jgi:hypothetical protein
VPGHAGVVYGGERKEHDGEKDHAMVARSILAVEPLILKPEQWYDQRKCSDTILGVCKV